MFTLYGNSKGRLIHLQTHGSFEVLVTMAEEYARRNRLAILVGPEDAILFRGNTHGEVLVYGGGPNLSQYLQRNTKAVAR